MQTEEMPDCDPKHLESFPESNPDLQPQKPENLKGKINILVQEGGTQTGDMLDKDMNWQLFGSFSKLSKFRSDGKYSPSNKVPLRTKSFHIPDELQHNQSPSKKEGSPESPEIRGGGFNTSGSVAKVFQNQQIKMKIKREKAKPMSKSVSMRKDKAGLSRFA